MAKYKIVVWLEGFHEIELPVDYANEYELKKDVVGLGVNGVFKKSESNYEYYPPHKIVKIDISEDKS